MSSRALGLRMRWIRIEKGGVRCEIGRRGRKDEPVCKGQSIRGENGAVSVDEDRFDPEETCDFAGVLATCSTETRKTTEKKKHHSFLGKDKEPKK